MKRNESIHSNIFSLIVILLAILINISSVPPYLSLVDNHVNVANMLNENIEEGNSIEETANVKNNFTNRATWDYHANLAFLYLESEKGILKLDIIVPPPEKRIFQHLFICG